MTDAKTFLRPPTLQFNLIAPPVDFSGRQMELARLRANAEHGIWLTTATGELGNGMTALARRLAGELAGNFPDGHLEIDLGGGSTGLVEPLSPTEAQRRLLTAFHPAVFLPDDEKTLEALYQETFATRKVLLLLDNAADPTQIEHLLPPPPSVAIITTQAESPPPAHMFPFRLGGLSSEEARALLMRIAPTCKKMSRRILKKVLQHFGNNPLALRIVAPLLRDVYDKAPHTLLTRYATIQKRVTALRTSGSNLPVTIALELAYETLSIAQRAFFEALAVFPAPFGHRAAATIWGLDLEAADALLVTFARKNLLMYYPGADLYALHDLVSFYTQELLLGQLEWTHLVMARYARYILVEVQRANALYRAGGIHQSEGLLCFMKVWPHAWAFWRRVSGVDAGWPRPQNGEQWLCDFVRQAFPIIRAPVPLASRAAILKRTLEAAHTLDREAEAITLHHLGQLYTARGDLARAIAVYESQLKLAYELHDRLGEATALLNIGTTCGALGNIQRARESWHHALALFRMMGDPRAAQVQAWLETLEHKLNPL